MQPTAEVVAPPLPEAPTYNPLSIIDKAVERGATPESLKQLLDLLKDWTAFQAEQAFNAAMAKCQAIMPTVVKDAENKGAKGAKYARLETVSRTIKPTYTEAGFSLSFTTEDSPLAEHVRIACDLMHRGGHTKRYRADVPLDGTGPKGGASSMNAPQATGSTFSYGRRYLTCLIFNVTIANEDDDGQGERGVIGGPEIAEINALWEECEKAGKVKDFARFLHWLGVESLEQLTFPGFTKAMAELNRKRRNGGGKS